MLQFFCILIIITNPFSVFSQIVFENSYGSQEHPIFLVTLENSGDKYAVYDQSASVLYLYNLNHSLFKSINIDTLTLGISPNSGQLSDVNFVAYVKENLFDLDNQVEFAWSYAQYNPTKIISAIIDESGTPLAIFDSCFVFNDQEGYFPSIRNTTNGTKLLTTNGYSAERKVYSLPGTLTCDPCTGVSGVIDPVGGSSRNKLKPFPVPASEQITIQYQLPSNVTAGTLKIYMEQGGLLKSIQLGPAFKTVNISVNEFSSGLYLYSIETPNGTIINSGKFIVE
jgi:hypothetical protein